MPANPCGCREDCPGDIICGNCHRYGSGAENITILALWKSLLKKEAPPCATPTPLGVGAHAISLYYRKSLSR